MAMSAIPIAFLFVLGTSMFLTGAEILPPESSSSSSSSSYASLSTDLQKRDVGHSLDVPEWLQDIPEESKVAKYRKRRFLNFPKGSDLAVTITVEIPIDGISEDTELTIQTEFEFDLPNNTDLFIGRSLNLGHTREDLYAKAEKFLDKFGYDGKACTLRTICEVAELPFEHGLFGEILNLLLTATMGASNYLEDNSLTDDYSTAEYYGRHHGSCHSIYPDCPVSFTNVLSRIVPKIEKQV